MDNNLFQRIKELIESNQTIGIIVSANPSFDQMAAGLGLYLALKQMNKNVSVVCPTDTTVGISSLVGIDKVQKSFGGVGGDLVVAFPYKDGEIEKVSYNVDGGKLQIVIKAGASGLSFNQSDVTYQQGGAAPSLIFFIGVPDTLALGFSKTPGTTVVNIDNSVQNTKYGDVVHVDSKFTSISEEVADFLTLLEPQIELDVDTSQNLLSGILSATNNFEGGLGSYLAFEMAGILMKKGAVRSASGIAAQQPTQAMPTNTYFPPQSGASVQQVVQPAPQDHQPLVEVQQPQQIFQSPKGTSFSEAASTVQPVQEQAAPVQQNVQQPPADWLTPKVYKGSSVI